MFPQIYKNRFWEWTFNPRSKPGTTGKRSCIKQEQVCWHLLRLSVHDWPEPTSPGGTRTGIWERATGAQPLEVDLNFLWSNICSWTSTGHRWQQHLPLCLMFPHLMDGRVSTSWTWSEAARSEWVHSNIPPFMLRLLFSLHLLFPMIRLLRFLLFLFPLLFSHHFILLSCFSPSSSSQSSFLLFRRHQRNIYIFILRSQKCHHTIWGPSLLPLWYFYFHHSSFLPAVFLLLPSLPSSPSISVESRVPRKTRDQITFGWHPITCFWRRFQITNNPVTTM